MPSEVGAPQRHKQPSRKGKKAWRKNVDITAIQDGLEDLREEIIQGGPIAEKESKHLFAVDTTSSEEIKRVHRLQKPLKADEILAKRSAVDSIDGRKRSNSRVTDGILLPASKRQKADWVSKKEVQRLKGLVQGGSQLTTTRLEEDESSAFDLWAIGGISHMQSKNDLDFLPIHKPKVAPQTIRKAPTALTANGKPVRAVRNPEAGSSYNPTFEDWDDLLTKEGEKEIEAERTRRHAAELEAQKEARIAVAAAEADEKAWRTDEESAWEGFETETEGSSLKKKRPERKNQAQRNKIKRRKEEERLARHEQNIRDRQRSAAQIDAALKAAEEKMLAKNAADATESSEAESGDDRILRRRRLGNASIQEKSLELVLPDELQDSLRRLRPEGNLLNDRFRNLLVNGKVEARKLILQPKTKKRTYTEKWSYKDFGIKV